MECANDLFLLVKVIYDRKSTPWNGTRPRLQRLHVSLNGVSFDRVKFLEFTYIC
jgi:hypothetical protein